MFLAEARTNSVRRVSQKTLIDISLVPEQSHNFCFSSSVESDGDGGHFRQRETSDQRKFSNAQRQQLFIIIIYPLECSLHLFSIFVGHATRHIEYS